MKSSYVMLRLTSGTVAYPYFIFLEYRSATSDSTYKAPSNQVAHDAPDIEPSAPARHTANSKSATGVESISVAALQSKTTTAQRSYCAYINHGKHTLHTIDFVISIFLLGLQLT